MTKKVLQFLVLVLVSSNAISQWSNDPTFNNAVCLARGGHTEPRIVSDAEGGAIIVWLEAYQNVYARIYAQRMSASGIALWTLDGVVVHSGGKLFRIEVVSDGLGGAIIVWHENRSQLDYDDDIYAQRINALGVRQWEPTGVLLCNSQGEQNFPVVCSDGGGGAIVVWRDFEDRINYAVFAQRVTSAGNVLWNPRGVPICTAATSALTSQAFPKVVSDGTGGANIMWDDRRGTSNDIYVQRINGLGTTLWTPNGVHVTSSPTDEYGVISPDGNKGVFIAWTDNELVYVQRVDSSGVVQYPGNGIAPCNNPSARSAPLIVSDGGSGAIVCWNSWQRTPPVFVQRISATGNLE